MAKSHTHIDDQKFSMSTTVDMPLYSAVNTYCRAANTKPSQLIRSLLQEWVRQKDAMLNADPEEQEELPITDRQNFIIDTICSVHSIQRPDTTGWTFSKAYAWIGETNNKTGFIKKSKK